MDVIEALCEMLYLFSTMLLAGSLGAKLMEFVHGMGR